MSSFRSRLGLVCLLGLVLRVAYTLLVAEQHGLSGDAQYYHQGANLLADGKGYIDPVRYNAAGQTRDIVTADGVATTITFPDPFEVPTAGHPPVYVTYLAAWSLIGVDTERGHRLASTLLGTSSIAFAGLAGRELGRRRKRAPRDEAVLDQAARDEAAASVSAARERAAERLGLVAAALCATYGFIWINDGVLMSETAAIAVAFATTWWALVFAGRPTLANAAIFGLLGGLCALTRAELVLYLPILAAITLLGSKLAWRDRIVRYGVAGLVAVACISPWVVRNLGAFEEPVLLSNGAGTVLVQTNCDDTYYGRDLGYWSINCGEPQPYGPNGEFLDESERDVVVRERAMDYISNHKQRLVTVVVPRRVGRMWGLYRPLEQIDLDVLFEARDKKASTLAFVQYVMLAPLAIAGAVLSRRRGFPLMPMVLWAALATFTSASTFGNTRYRTAAEISIVLLASITVLAVIEWHRGRARAAPDQALV